MPGKSKEIIKPFLRASSEVIVTLLDQMPPEEELLEVGEGQELGGDVASFIGVAGSVAGRVIITMNDTDALRFASIMLQKKVHELDGLVKSAIGEMANMIAGNATIELSGKGFPCDITPPTVLCGENVKISHMKGLESLSVKYNTGVGAVNVIIALRENRGK